MASRLLQFPSRNAFVPAHSRDSLARDTQEHDTQTHAARIAEQVEQEMARKAQRMAVGMRIEMADARRGKVVKMPSVRDDQRVSLLDRTLSLATAAVNRLRRS